LTKQTEDRQTERAASSQNVSVVMASWTRTIARSEGQRTLGEGLD